MEKFKEYIENKRVLDIGCVGQAKNSKFVKHQQIESFKPSYLAGVDIQEKELSKARKKFNKNIYNLFYWDIIEKPPEIFFRKENIYNFDSIFMLDVIEHIDNCGSALKNLYPILEKNGHVIVTTPNVFFSKWYTQSHIKNKVNINPDHVHWFCKQTLQALFERHNFKLVKYLHSNGLVGVFTK